jgi:hypothetical protein
MPKNTNADPELNRYALIGIDAEIGRLQDQLNALEAKKKQLGGTGGARATTVKAPAAAAGQKKMPRTAREKVGASVAERWKKARSLGLPTLRALADWEKAHEGKGAKKGAKAAKKSGAKKAAKKGGAKKGGAKKAQASAPAAA